MHNASCARKTRFPLLGNSFKGLFDKLTEKKPLFLISSYLGNLIFFGSLHWLPAISLAKKKMSVQPTVQSPHYGLKPFSALVTSSVSHSRKCELSRTFSSTVLSKSVDASSKLPNFNGAYRPSCKSKMDAVSDGGSSKTSSQGLGKCGEKKLHFSRTSSQRRSPWRRHDSSLGPRIDFLEPMMLDFKHDSLDWPDEETVVWATIEQKAKSLDIPLSLRMIKKKLQSRDHSRESTYCAAKSAFSSMVFIVAELQSCALRMREEASCHEDLELITSKVQKDMRSSFAWLFRQVFSKTPDLMLRVMILLVNFIEFSASHNWDSSRLIESTQSSKIDYSTQASQETTVRPCNETELNLWNSLVDDAFKIQPIDKRKILVSPVSVEIEPDNYEDYIRTDLTYQANLSLEPNNSLLLCNYAQFLHLVAKDYDRAEECFKRAVQSTPTDYESLSQYANFLWIVRKDFSGAEERFLQALAGEPENPYYASKYASFLYITGGDETCFPL